MDRIACLYINQEFFVIKTTSHSENYITIESLYPYQGIKADYFQEETDFFEDCSLPLLFEFSVHVIHPFYFLVRFPEQVGIYMGETECLSDSADIEIAVKKYISNYRDELNLKYYSKLVQIDLYKAYMQFKSDHTIPYKANWSMQGEEKEMEKVHEIILKQGISSVFFFDYNYQSGPIVNCTKKIDISEVDYSEELLLQELFLCKYSGPRIDQYANPFLEPYFQERFNNFSDQKKLGLFMFCNANKELHLYNKCLAAYWMNRY